jgi:hypothetical protein
VFQRFAKASEDFELDWFFILITIPNADANRIEESYLWDSAVPEKT